MPVVAVLREHDQVAVADLERRLHGFAQTRGVFLVRLEPVDHRLDVVPRVALQLFDFLDALDLAVDARADEALALQVFEHRLVVALAAANHGREQLQLFAFMRAQDLLHDRLGRLRLHRLVTVGAVRDAGTGVEHAQVVDDLGQRADRRARAAPDGLLIDRDRRRQAVDALHVRLLHPAEELARVGRQRLEEAALSFAVERVERQRTLARPGDTGHPHQALARDLEVHAAQVVLAGVADLDAAGGHAGG